MGGRHRTGYLYRRGKTWWLKYELDGQIVYQSLETTSKTEALDKRNKIMRPMHTTGKADTLAILVGRLNTAKVDSALAEDELRPPLAVTDAWVAFQNAANRPDSGPATLATYKLQWGCFVTWLLGDAQESGETAAPVSAPSAPKHKAPAIRKPKRGAHPKIKLLRDVSRLVASEYAASLTKRGVTPNTYNKHIRVCEMVFRVLKDQAKSTENPWTEITRKKLVHQSRRELTTAELRKVCQAAEGELRTLLALGLYIGARLADAATFDWSNIDLNRRHIRFTPRKTARQSGRILTVPLHPALHAVLSETSPEKRQGPILPRMERLYGKKGPYAVSTIIQDHFITCGITTTRPGRGVRRVVSAGFHSLRHSAVSLLREAGAPLSVTMSIVGHSSLAIHDGYTHSSEEAMQRAVAALPSIMDANPSGRKVLPPVPPPPDNTPTTSATHLRAAIANLTGMTAKTWTAARKAALMEVETALNIIEGAQVAPI